jgi:hypothetical protein
MDCRTAREILEVLPPAAGGREGGGLADGGSAGDELLEAVAHLDGCDDCTLAVREQQEFDRRIGRVVRDVPVPGGLKERLFEALNVEPLPAGVSEGVPAGAVAVRESAPEQADRDMRPRRSHRALLAALSAAVVLLALVGWWLLPESGPRTTLARLYEAVPLDVSSAAPFDGSFEAPLPGGGWASGRLFFERTPKGSDLGLGGSHAVALYGFRFRGRDGSVVAGVLAVAPAGTIDAGGPIASSFAGGEPDYPRPSGGRQLAARTWLAGDVMYVCLVPAERMDELRQLLNLPIG